jgi:hypothetical protein
MSASVLVLTCDRYRPYWDGFWHFMERHWDFGIDVPVYMCNESARADTAPGWCRQVLTGGATFVENLKRALETVGSDEVFLMLEDFWPIAPMKRELFWDLHGRFREGGWDALQVSNYTPYYKVRGTEIGVAGRTLLEFERDSDWIFNFQARFWRSGALYDALVEPEVSERAVGSAITAEMASDRRVRERGGMRACLYHYLWYPLSGVSYRGELTEYGRQLQNIVEIDRHVDGMFSRRAASSSRPVCSG